MGKKGVDILVVFKKKGLLSIILEQLASSLKASNQIDKKENDTCVFNTGTYSFVGDETGGLS
jgi:hypothetical protein